MPNIKSAAKRVRQDEKRRMRNRINKSKLRTALKKYDGAEDKAEALPKAFAALDRAVGKGVIHRNKADRKKSRLAKKLQKEQAEKA
jgi:small subunit ribosomal protein S20